MPCYTVSTASIRLKADSLDILKVALRSDTVENIKMFSDLSGTIDGKSFSIGLDGNVNAETSVAGAVANAINRAYSREVLKTVGRKFGWTTTAASATSYVATKRA